MVTRSHDLRSQIDPQKLAKQMVYEYLKSKDVISEDMSREEIKRVIEDNLTSISANKLIDLFGTSALTSTKQMSNAAVTFELKEKKEQVGMKMEQGDPQQVSLMEASEAPMQDMTKNDEMEMFVVALEKIQRSVKAFGMIRPSDDIMLIEDELVNLDKSKRAIGLSMPKGANDEDPADKPVPKTPAEKELPASKAFDEYIDKRPRIRGDGDQNMKEVRKIMEEYDEEVHSSGPLAPICDMALQNLHYVYDRLGNVAHQLEILKSETDPLQEYHGASAPIMMRDAIETVHNNPRIEAIMESTCSIMSDIAEISKNMHPLRPSKCPQFNISSPVEINQLAQFNNVDDNIEMLPKLAQPIIRPPGVDVASVGGGFGALQVLQVQTHQRKELAQRAANITHIHPNSSTRCTFFWGLMFADS